jgi:hypothetical protein
MRRKGEETFLGAVQATPMHFDLIENIFLDNVSNSLVPAIMLVVIVFCIILRRLVMNCLCKRIKLKGRAGEEANEGLEIHVTPDLGAWESLG